MTSIFEKVKQAPLNRRKFLAVSSAAAAAASLGLAGCQSSKVKAATEEEIAEIDLENGKWIPHDCLSTHGGCGSRCFNRSYVVDGVIVRQGTDNTHEDTEDFPQQRGCLKGRSARWYLTSADRIKHPMKRKHWSPGGGDNVNGHLRGLDEWERISWDDAISVIVSELTRIRDTYGNRSLLATGYLDPRLGNGGWLGSCVLNLFGGCLTSWGQESSGGAFLTSNMMLGQWATGMLHSSDKMAFRHAKLIVLWGFNPAWSAAGGSTVYNFIVGKRKSGAKVILIDPWFNPTAQALADEWIPCRPGTDGAMLEAIAYEIITNNWQDQDFLDRCCVGFDAEHMPDDAKTDENFKDYILGAYDGVPKTPEWASSICGASAETIRHLAEQMGTVKPMALKASMGPARTYYGNRFAQLFYTVGWMTGSCGLLGAETVIGGGTGKAYFGAGPKGMISLGTSGYQFYPNAICTEARSAGLISAGKLDPDQEYGIAHAECFKAILEGEYTPAGHGGEKRPCNIKAIYRDNPHNTTSQFTGGCSAEEAYRKVEFVVVHDMMFNSDARLADIVLPITTTFELDISTWYTHAPAEFLVVGGKVIEPYYESKSDAEIYYLIADKLGMGEDVVPRMSVKQGEFNKIAGTTVLKEDGVTYEPLVSITEEDLKRYEVEGTPQEGLVPIAELFGQGCYQIPRKPDDKYTYYYGKEFREDPEGNPLKTFSGKNEIYCQSLKDYQDLIGFHDVDALPKYKPAVEGHEQRQQEGEYPFQMVTLHHIRQAHSIYSTSRQLNEVFSNDLLMSEYDADSLGFSKGDWVQVSSSTGGKIARRLNVMPNIMPGVVIIGQGNQRRIDADTGVDIGGNANTLTVPSLLGDGYQAYNSLLVKIEKWTGPALTPDYLQEYILQVSE